MVSPSRTIACLVAGAEGVSLDPGICAKLAGSSGLAGEPYADVVKDLDRWPLKCRCDGARDLSEQHDARHGDIVGGDGAELGEQVVGVDELAALQPPGEGGKQQGCVALGGGEEVVVRAEHALFLLRGGQLIVAKRRVGPWVSAPGCLAVLEACERLRLAAGGAPFSPGLSLLRAARTVV